MGQNLLNRWLPGHRGPSVSLAQPRRIGRPGAASSSSGADSFWAGSSAGRGTTLARSFALGANTPCAKVALISRSEVMRPPTAGQM
jgi:hypothetical protein